MPEEQSQGCVLQCRQLAEGQKTSCKENCNIHSCVTRDMEESLRSSSGKASTRPSQASHQPQDANSQEAPSSFTSRATQLPEDSNLQGKHSSWQTPEDFCSLYNSSSICYKGQKQARKSPRDFTSRQAWQMHLKVASGNQQPFLHQTQVPSRMLSNLLQTQGFLNILLYVFSLITFFHFARVWLDNQKCNLQKGWAFNSCNRGQNSWGLSNSQPQHSTLLKKSDEFPSWNSKWVKHFYMNFSSLLAPAWRRGTAVHCTSLRCSVSKLTCLPSTCALLWWVLWEKLVRIW